MRIRISLVTNQLRRNMEMMAEDDATKYEAHFSKYLENDIDADKIEDMYTEAHKKIRENPDFSPKAKKNISWSRKGNKVTSSDGKDVTRSMKQRKEKVSQKIAAATAKLAAGDDE